MADIGSRQPVLTGSDGRFFRNGEPHVVVAGAIHYFRVHPGHWRDRLKRLKALGLNTIDAYVAWNFHQPRPSAEPDFTGPRDLGAFIDLAGELGFDVIVRPGPYICAEWDNGGLPYWVTRDPKVRIRRTNPRFQELVERWFDQLLPQIVPRQAAHGGPIVAVQIENEYGSYGDDAAYLRWNHDALQQRGITELLFTADGGNDFFLDGGSLPDVLAAATLGSRGAEAIETWQRRRPGEPFLAMEFWNGWFDHWGEPHHVRDPKETAQAFAEVLDRGGSICVYMAHGGTNFGFGAGSNHDGTRLQPTATSYDYDAPVGEDGTLTEKFFALRPALHAAAGRTLLPVPDHLATPPTLPAARLPLVGGRTPLQIARAAIQRAAERATDPMTFDDLDLPNGAVLYRTKVALAGPSTLRLPDLADRALVWLNAEFIGEIDHTDPSRALQLPASDGAAQLEILVTAYGRINYGPRTGAPKGLLGGVLIGQRFTFDWDHAALDIEQWMQEDLDALACARFEVAEPRDAHLALPDSGFGLVWMNGFLLGRFDTPAGPQRTLYVPAGLVRQGENVVHVLDFNRPTEGAYVELRERPDLGPVTDRPAQDSLVV